MPQQDPFRFIDEILELDRNTSSGPTGSGRMNISIRGHFPGRPITPGVILIETMAQTGVVAFGLYLLMEHGAGPG